MEQYRESPTDEQSERVSKPTEPVKPEKERSEEPKAKSDESPPEDTKADYESHLKPLSAGDIVPGLVVQIDEHGALVDVGTKSEGVLPSSELKGEDAASGEQLQVGSQVDVYVVRSEDEEGRVLLSKKKADYEKAWVRILEAHKTGEPMTAMVTERVKGGLVVDLGLRGFLPASHVATRNVRALDRFVGQSIPIKVIEVDRARKRVVVSQRLALEEEKGRKRKEVLESIQEGEMRQGTVRRITNYGAFVDIGGIDGLLHISEMSWTRIGHPSEVVKPGDKIDVMVLKCDRERERISLGLKQILPDPWQQIEEKFTVGDVITGKVTRVVPFGAFIQVEGGIEGIIPNSELADERVTNPEEMISANDVVQVRMIALRPNERRMTLSLRQAQQEKEKREYRDYMTSQREGGRVTLGDLVGDALAARKAEKEAEEPEGDQESQSSESPEESPPEKAQSPPSSNSEEPT